MLSDIKANDVANQGGSSSMYKGIWDKEAGLTSGVQIRFKWPTFIYRLYFKMIGFYIS